MQRRQSVLGTLFWSYWGNLSWEGARTRSSSGLEGIDQSLMIPVPVKLKAVLNSCTLKTCSKLLLDALDLYPTWHSYERVEFKPELRIIENHANRFDWIQRFRPSIIFQICFPNNSVFITITMIIIMLWLPSYMIEAICFCYFRAKTSSALLSSISSLIG